MYVLFVVMETMLVDTEGLGYLAPWYKSQYIVDFRPLMIELVMGTDVTSVEPPTEAWHVESGCYWS